MMKNESSSFKSSLVWLNKLEHVIRPFIHGYPFNIAIKFNTGDIYYHSIPDILVHNNFKTNQCNLLFYYTNELNNINDDYNFNISITNKIEIEWLFNVLPIYYKPNNFKNSIVYFNGKKIALSEYNGDLFNNFCHNLKNKWSLNNIPYISSNMVILSEFFKNYKKYSINHEM